MRPLGLSGRYLAATALGVAAVAVAGRGSPAGVAVLDAVGASAAVALAAGARRIGGRDARPWWAFAGAAALLVVGDALGSTARLEDWSAAALWPGSLLAAAGRLGVLAGVALLVTRARSPEARTRLVDGAIVSFALAALGWPFLFDTSSLPRATALDRATTPAWELLLLAVGVGLLFARPFAGRWTTLLALAAWAALASELLASSGPHRSVAAAPLAVAAFGLWGASALDPSARRLEAPVGFQSVVRRFLVLALPIVALRAAVSIGKQAGEETSWTWVTVGGALGLLVLWRIVETLRSLDRTQRELAASEGRFHGVFEHSLDAMLLAGDDGVYVDANEAACELLGRGREEIVGRRQEELVGGSAAGWSQFLAAGVRQDELPLARPDGSERIVDYRAAANIRPGLHLVVLRDVTERRQHEHALQEADRQKDELISVVSHDLRTPLTSVLGFLELALDASEHPESGDDPAEFLHVALRNAERLSRLVEDLLFVSRANAGRAGLELEPLDLAAAVERAVEAAQPAAAAAGVELALAAEEVVAPLDAHRLAQTVENLLSNAVKFTPPGGRIDVRVLQEDGAALVEVHDTGRGIDPRDLEHVFDRFYRADDTEGVPGTGLGLSIVKAIVEAHGGSVGVESRLGEGTTFRLRLPLAERVPALSASA